jgi:hypothetical protein
MSCPRIVRRLPTGAGPVAGLLGLGMALIASRRSGGSAP